MTTIHIPLTKPQEDFVFSKAKFPAFVGGYGAGKTEALVTRLLLLKMMHPRGNVGYFAPTNDLIRLIGWPKFAGKLEQWGLPYRLNKVENSVAIQGLGNVYFRSLDNPARIVGFELTDAGIDELDTLKLDHAKDSWNKVIARCRQSKDGKPNTCAVSTTPEGYRFVYERWAKEARTGYELFKSPTRDNPFLPEDYIEGLS